MQGSEKDFFRFRLGENKVSDGYKGLRIAELLVIALRLGALRP